MFVFGGELTALVDDEVAAEVLGFQQINVAAARHDQMVNLRHLAIHDKTQVMQHHMVAAFIEVMVDVISGIPLAGDALFQIRQLVAQPVFLRKAQ